MKYYVGRKYTVSEHYRVEAPSLEEAKRMVKAGEVEPVRVETRKPIPIGSWPLADHS